jgi:hypothetical protein
VSLDGERVIDWGGAGDVGVLGSGFFFGDECVASKGVGVHVSCEHHMFWWGRALAVLAAEEEEG